MHERGYGNQQPATKHVQALEPLGMNKVAEWVAVVSKTSNKKVEVEKMAIKKVPIVLAIERDEKGNLSTWCQYCRKFHHHGIGEGHRDAHCFEEDSPYIRTGYILKKMKLGGKEISRKEN